PVDACAPTVLTRLLDRSGHRKAAAGVRDQNVDRSQLLLDLTAHRLDLAELGDVGGHPRRASTGALDLRLHGGQPLDVAPVHGNPGAVSREQPRDRGANAARATRHERYLP